MSVQYYPYGKILREWNPNTEKFLTTHHERDTETGLDYRGARYYDSDIARFLSLDPKADDYVSWSPYNYVLGNPLLFVDPDGRNPIIIGALAITAIDALLIATGVVATGLILYKAQDGSFAINSNISELFYKDNPGFREQQKRERSSQRETVQIIQKHTESVNNNIGKPTPDGDNSPKGGGGAVAKAVVATGLAAEVIKSFTPKTEKTSTKKENKPKGNTTKSEDKTTKTTPQKKENTTNDYLAPITLPSDNTRVDTPIIL